MNARIRMNPKINAPAPVQAELPMIVAPTSVPSTAELFTKTQLVARHPHLLSLNRVVWALRCRAVNGLSAAVFDSPCGELLIHEPSFLGRGDEWANWPASRRIAYGLAEAAATANCADRDSVASCGCFSGRPLFPVRHKYRSYSSTEGLML